MQSAVLAALLSVILMAMLAPNLSVWAVHPASVILVFGILFGFRLIQLEKSHPHWEPADEDDLDVKDQDEPEVDEEDEASAGLWGRYALYAALVGGGGYIISRSATGIMAATGLPPVMVGATLMAIPTSFPELVTAIAAVRRGRISLALGDIIGGNAFDTLFLALSDAAYREGPIYCDVSGAVRFLVATTLLMTAVLLVGLVRRQQKGPGDVGVASYVLIGVYVVGVLMTLAMGGLFGGLNPGGRSGA